MRVERGKPEDYAQFSTRPVPIRPFDPDSKRAALAYGARLNKTLAPMGVAAELHGSLALGLAGKGEWEFALYPSPERWYPTLTLLVWSLYVDLNVRTSQNNYSAIIHPVSRPWPFPVPAV